MAIRSDLLLHMSRLFLETMAAVASTRSSNI